MASDPVVGKRRVVKPVAIGDNFDDDDVPESVSPMAVAADVAVSQSNTSSTAPPPRRIGGFGLDSTARKTEAGSPQNAVNSSGIVTVTSDTTDDKTDEGTTKKFGRRAVGVPIESVASGAITTVDKWNRAETGDMQAIPDLEIDNSDENRQDSSEQTAGIAPNVRTQRVQPLQELDRDLTNQLPTGGLDGIDLSLLSAVLFPQVMLAEPDEVWDFDSIVTEVAGLLQQEQDDRDEGKAQDDETEQNAIASSSTASRWCVD